MAGVRHNTLVWPANICQVEVSSKPEMGTILSGLSEAVPDSQVYAYQEACRMTLCISPLNLVSTLWPKPIHSHPLV